jgi:hypothetical protein
LFSALQQGGQISGRVLSVAIECNGPFKTGIVKMRETGLQRRAFALIALMAKYHRTGVFGLEDRFIGRAVIHDDDKIEMPTQFGNQRVNGAIFVETGYDGGASHGRLL